MRLFSRGVYADERFPFHPLPNSRKRYLVKMLPDGNSFQECIRPNLFPQTLSSSDYTADAHKSEDRGDDAEDGGWEEDVRSPGPQSDRYRGGTICSFMMLFL